jgi:hypothetical protein
MSHRYYQNQHGLMAGPYTDADFREFRETGVERDTTLIWRTGWKAWTTYDELWKSTVPESASADLDGTAPGDGPPAPVPSGRTHRRSPVDHPHVRQVFRLP